MIYRIIFELGLRLIRKEMTTCVGQDFYNDFEWNPNRDLLTGNKRGDGTNCPL